ncbi:hypothetical protein AVEN_270613-1 [Araneus ventricosus]|uniref:Uncharacterized protein n=1 Tax=Araneus ventricosus TaxID=182803 RepID=A0A4Y2DK12_ARAVE|nr:hypothetical protein AVEN_270613-1 [Araneus ventricosus]
MMKVVINFFFVLRKVIKLKKEDTYEGRTDLHYSVGWEWHQPSTLNATHRTQITHDTIAKLIMKSKRTGSVIDARSGRPKTATDEGTSTQVPAAMVESPEDVATSDRERSRP